MTIEMGMRDMAREKDTHWDLRMTPSLVLNKPDRNSIMKAIYASLTFGFLHLQSLVFICRLSLATEGEPSDRYRQCSSEYHLAWASE